MHREKRFILSIEPYNNGKAQRHRQVRNKFKMADADNVWCMISLKKRK